VRQRNQNTPFGSLTKIFTPLDAPMMFVLLLIALISTVTMWSAASDMPSRFDSHVRNMLVGFSVMLVFAYIPPKRLMQAAPFVYGLGIALLVAVALFGQTKLGAKRWLNVGINIQPSELLKIAVPMMLALYFHNIGDLRHRRASHVFGIAALLLLVPFGLIAKQPDLGTAILVVLAGSFVIFFAGLPWRMVIGLVAGGIILITLVLSLIHTSFASDVLHLKPYQIKRIEVLLDPTADPRGAGFHILQAETAIGSGGWLGKGWQQGTQTHLQFIPERSTDFLIAVFAEEFGLLGVLLLLMLYFVLILRGLSIAHNASTKFERLLAGAISMILFAYVFVNMGMVAGLLPVVGVPLPFMSYGGTALITLGVGCGMLMSVRHHRIR
jgi:rod shape determining protein RodA